MPKSGTRLSACLLAMACAAPVTALAGPPPMTCYDTRCAPQGGMVYKGAEHSVGLDASGVSYSPKLTVERLELEAVDVRIPKPPYGVTGRGQCFMRFAVEADGSVSGLVIQRCPDAYAAHIQESSRQWSYVPATTPEGEPVRTRNVTMTLPWASEQVSVTTFE